MGEFRVFSQARYLPLTTHISHLSNRFIGNPETFTATRRARCCTLPCSPLQSVHRKPWNVHRDAPGALLHITVTGIERLKVCRVRLNSSYGQKQVGNQIEPPPIW